MDGAMADVSEVLEYYNITTEKGLQDCGCAGDNPNFDLLFPRKVMGRWSTVLANTNVNAENFDHEAELAALALAPEGALTKMAQMCNLTKLESSYFIIEKLEFFAYDSDNSISPNWLLNYFNPQFMINDEALIGGIDSGSTGSINKSGLGLVLPICLPFRAPFRPLKDLDVNAQLRKKDTNGVLRHLPLVCNAVFQYR